MPWPQTGALHYHAQPGRKKTKEAQSCTLLGKNWFSDTPQKKYTGVSYSLQATKV